MIPVDKIDSKFTFVLAAAKRARQLQAGAKPLLPTIARKPTRMAMEEMVAGVIPYELPSPEGEQENGKEKKAKTRRKSK